MAVKFRITGVNFQYDDQGNNEYVDLNFSTTDSQQLIYASGRTPIPAEEYFQANNLAAMADIVKEKFIERLTVTEEEETTEE
ncbi:hypothetical protein [Alkalicoccobacillus murimartini]|uniref:DUF1659 domain-containing protein n=1 Tax=Alkalicoccobacillus murimartini TaxID=171685 RepID=A0ABT9YFN1_9BACI|nr:hypothetical protein [Alkalicoccobacillus murimartini]MDQ0206661.1 hypothetical protein [Alkalicoccobacillus murimartini]